jgi:potassium-transporting ATPase potassium-binding subunit
MKMYITPYQWLDLIGLLVLLFLITKPLGIYLYNVMDPKGKTFLDWLLKPVERLTYRVTGIDPEEEQNWKQYAMSMVTYTLVAAGFTYIIFRVQQFLPLNPQKFGNLSPDLSFNSAISFATNTNWQAYTGESVMSYFSQNFILLTHFLSSAIGVGVMGALVRGIARHTSQTIGSFWTDVVRISYYILMPICFVFSIFLISQGMIQNFKPYTTATLMEPMTVQVPKMDAQGKPVNDAQGKPVMVSQTITTQTIPQGPMASQVSIKLLGTNGGGYTGANAAHPFENPNPLSNFIQLLSTLIIASAATYYFGMVVKDQKHGWAIWGAMVIILLIGFFAILYAEQAGNPIHQKLGIAAAGGNMEGKEVRFGIFDSALYSNTVVANSDGANNSMYDSFTPLSVLVLMVNIQLGGLVFGAVGAGLENMLIHVLLAVFLAGLMVGRTPEYLGKKFAAYDVKVLSIAVLMFLMPILGFTGWALVNKTALAGLGNNGPRGLSEILYAFTSVAANNGTALGGLSANTPWWNTVLAFGMFFGRVMVMVPVIALAGALAKKKILPPGPGAFPVSSPTFTVLLVAVIVLLAGLTFFPMLALGPIVEHYLMHAGTLY